MTYDSKLDDEDSIAQTLRPSPRFSQRPTLPINKPPEQQAAKQYPPIKYKFYLIGIVIVVIIITAIICITKPLQSYSMPERAVFNLPPIVIPNETAIPQKIEVPIILNKQIENIAPKPAKKIIEIKKRSTDKDYGI